MSDGSLPFGKDAQPEYPEVQPRKYLPPKAKAALVLKQGGLCAGCGVKPRAFEYDHIIALDEGGTNDPSNWQALGRCCHVPKTGAHAKRRAKTNRLRGKTGQVKRRKERGPLLKSRSTFPTQRPLLSLPQSMKPDKAVNGFKWGKTKWPKGRKFRSSTRSKATQS